MVGDKVLVFRLIEDDGGDPAGSLTQRNTELINSGFQMPMEGISATFLVRASIETWTVQLASVCSLGTA